MTAFLQIDQAGLSAGTPGVARTDGRSNGALVTLRDTGPLGLTTTMRMLWVPLGDSTAAASLTPTGDPKVWTFTPTAGTYGSYLIELVRGAGTLNETREKRVFGVRLPKTGLLIPALNEGGDRNASLLNSGPAVTEAANNNAADFADTGLNSLGFAAWWRATQELYVAAEIAGGAGENAIYLERYLRIQPDVADAIALALTENPDAVELILPGRDLVVTRRIGDFLGGDGLRGKLRFVGVRGATRLIRPTGINYTSMFAFPQGAEDVSWSGVAIHLEDTSVAGCLALHAYDVKRWFISGCALVCDDAPTNQGNGCGLGLFGSNIAIVTDCHLKRGQVAFAGLGYGCNGAIFNDNTCEDVHDFAASAVTGPPEETPLEIKNVVFEGNTVRGMNGTGCFFAGSDGSAFPADVVQGVRICGNTFVGGVELGHVGARTVIVFCSGIVTSEISLCSNNIADDEDSVQTQYGIFVSNCIGATSFTSLDVSSNLIGKLGAAGGINGIYIDTVLLDGSQICSNILRGNRGIFLANPVNVKVRGNQIYEATSDALQIVASSRNISGLDLFDNYIEATALFAVALRLITQGSFTAALTVERCTIRATQGGGFVYQPNSGSAAVNWYDNTIPPGAGGIDAPALAAIVNARPARELAAIGVDLSAPVVLTLLPTGHKPGTYLVSLDVVNRTAPAAPVTLSRSISYNAPTFGATAAAPANVSAGSDASGHAYQGQLGPIPIRSSGSAPVTLTCTFAGVTGTPVVDFYGSADLAAVPLN